MLAITWKETWWTLTSVVRSKMVPNRIKNFDKKIRIEMLGAGLAIFNLVCCIASSKTRRKTQPEFPRHCRLHHRRNLFIHVRLWHLNLFRSRSGYDHICDSPTSGIERSVHRLQSRNRHYNEKKRCIQLNGGLGCLVLCSDCGEFFAMYHVIVVSMEVCLPKASMNPEELR